MSQRALRYQSNNDVTLREMKTLIEAETFKQEKNTGRLAKAVVYYCMKNPPNRRRLMNLMEQKIAEIMRSPSPESASGILASLEKAFNSEANKSGLSSELHDDIERIITNAQDQVFGPPSPQ